MPITLKDIAEVIGLPVDDESKLTTDIVKEHVDKKFVARDIAAKDPEIKNAVFGKVVGEVRTKIKQLGGFESKEVEKEDIVPLLDKLNAHYTGQINELKEKANAGGDKKLLDLQKELEERDKKIGVFKTALEEKEALIQKTTSEFDSKFKGYKIGDKLTKIKSEIPWTDDYKSKPVQQKGFEAMFNEKYKAQLNDKEELEIVSIDGTPIKHPKKAGEFMSPAEVIMFEAEKEGLIKKANVQGEKKKIIIPGNENEPVVKSKVHAKARANAERTPA